MSASHLLATPPLRAAPGSYVPIFFPKADLSQTPNIVAYMRRCAERPAFAEAFGDGHADLVRRKADEWSESGSGAGFKMPFGL